MRLVPPVDPYAPTRPVHIQHRRSTTVASSEYPVGSRGTHQIPPLQSTEHALLPYSIGSSATPKAT